MLYVKYNIEGCVQLSIKRLFFIFKLFESNGQKIDAL